MPFITNLTQCVKLFPDNFFYNNWVNTFFREYLLVIKAEDSELKCVKDDELVLILKTYIDCLRLFIQRSIHNVSVELNELINGNNEINLDNLTEDEIDDNLLFKILFEKHLLTVLKLLFTHPNEQIATNGLDQLSYMISFYYKHCTNVSPYSKLLSLILDDVKNYMEDIFKVNVNHYPAIEVKNLTQFITLMYGIFHIKYSDETEFLDGNGNSTNDINTNLVIKTPSITEPIEIYRFELKNITIQLLRLCINNGMNCDRIYCMENICTLTYLFKDKYIYANLTEKGTLMDTIDCLLYFLKHKKTSDDKQMNSLIKLIFAVLYLDSIDLNPSMFQRLMEVCSIILIMNIFIHKLILHYCFLFVFISAFTK